MLKTIFSKDFLFTTTKYAPLSSADKILLVLFGACLVIAVLGYLYWYLKKDRPITARLARRIAGGMLVFGIVGAGWSEVRYLAVPYMGYRFTAGLILLCWLFWLTFIIRYLVFKFPPQTRAWEQEQIKQKYLRAK